MFVPSSWIILYMPELLGVLAVVLVLLLGVLFLMLVRQSCPQRLPPCLRPKKYIKYELFALREVVTDNAPESTDNIYIKELKPSLRPFSASPDSVVSLYTAVTHPTFPPFSDSSLSSSSWDSLPSLDVDPPHRGQKRKRVPTDDSDLSHPESDDWVLGDKWYLHPRPPTTEAEVIQRLEKGFTGTLKNNEKPQFFIYNWPDKS